MIAAIAMTIAACSSSDTEASVAIASPGDGEAVSTPVTIEMTAENFDIQPAGTVGEGTGHFHLMIEVPCVAPGEVIPADDNHLHYGDASTTAQLDLAPGTYTVCLQAGDGIHTALDLTDTITFTVSE